MATHQCPCGTHVRNSESFHRGFDLISSSDLPQFVYMHFCSIPCRNAWIDEAPMYTPPPPTQPSRIPTWGHLEYS